MAEIKYLFPIKAEFQNERLDSLNETMESFGFHGKVVLESPIGDVTITVKDGQPMTDERADQVRAELQRLADDVAKKHKQFKFTVGAPRRIK